MGIIEFLGGKNLLIQYKIMFLIIIILGLTLGVAAIIVERGTVPRFERQLALYARDIAYSVAETPEIKKYIDYPDGDRIIHPIVDRIMKRTDVRYILAIGGEDAKPVIEGVPYSSFPEVATLGPTLRAYVPVTRGGVKVGAVAVYLWTRDVNLLIWSLRKKIILAVVFGMAIGAFFAHFLARNIKNSMFGMEPHQIASLLKEREVLLESVKEGILAIDNAGNIVFMNHNARQLLNLSLDEKVEGKPVEQYVPNTRLREIIVVGQAQHDQEQYFADHSVITNRIPIIIGGRVCGAIASFRSVDEMRELAEELTGVKKLAEVLGVQNEALRVQKHEFLNKLHTVSGLIQLGEYDEALKITRAESSLQQESIRLVTDNIRKPAVAGLILGKIGRCRELGITFHLSDESFLNSSSRIDDESLIVCLGNLIENAMEAVLSKAEGARRIDVLLRQHDGLLYMRIADNGPGVSKSMCRRIFQKGYTSKSGGKRGYGLYLVKSIVDSYGGDIRVNSLKGEGTTIILTIPESESHV